MKRLLLSIFIVISISTSVSFSQNFWQGLDDYGNWKINTIGANNNTILADKWWFSGGVNSLYRNKQPNNYWNIRGPAVLVWDIEFFPGGNIILGTVDGAYLSTDDGISWTQIGLSGFDIFDIYIDAGIAYCALWGAVYSYNPATGVWTDLNFNYTVMTLSIIVSGGNVYVGSDENAIYVFNGTDWNIADNSVTNNPDAGIFNLLEVPGNQYATTSNGLYSSAGGWANWSPETNLPHWDFAVDDIVKDNANNVYVYNGFDVFKNAAGNWNAMTSDGMYTTEIDGLAFDAVKNILYAAGEGVYKYDDINDRWNFLGLSPLYLMSSTTDLNNDIFFGSSGAGVVKVENDSAKIKNNGLNHGVVFSLAVNNNNYIYAGTNGGGIYKSTDNGESWAQTDTTLPGNEVRAIVINNNGDIFAGTFGNGVYKSQGNDENWLQVNNGLTNTFVTALSYYSDYDVLFAGTHSNGVFYSTNSGSNWQQTALDNYDVHSLTINSAGDVFAATQTGLFKIYNNSNTWDNFETLISDSTFFSININEDGILFAGTSNFGAFLSYDNGNNWIEKNTGLNINGLPVRAITTFTFDADGYAYNGTIGGGIFKSTSPVTEVSESEAKLPTDFNLEQNYPNPFNPTTKIKYSIPFAGTSLMKFVQLKVYNILGNEVKTLVNEEKPAGSYEVEFNAANLPSGIYFYELRAGSFIKTKKMILLK